MLSGFPALARDTSGAGFSRFAVGPQWKSRHGDGAAAHDSTCAADASLLATLLLISTRFGRHLHASDWSTVPALQYSLLSNYTHITHTRHTRKQKAVSDTRKIAGTHLSRFSVVLEEGFFSVPTVELQQRYETLLEKKYITS